MQGLQQPPPLLLALLQQLVAQPLLVELQRLDWVTSLHRLAQAASPLPQVLEVVLVPLSLHSLELPLLLLAALPMLCPCLLAVEACLSLLLAVLLLQLVLPLQPLLQLQPLAAHPPLP